MSKRNRQRSSSGDPPTYQEDVDKERRRNNNRTVLSKLRKKLSRERSISDDQRYHPSHPPLTKANTLPCPSRSNHSSTWGLEEVSPFQGGSDESLDSGSDPRGIDCSGSDCSPRNQRSSIYDEVAVQKAFGPAMRDIGRWFTQQQRLQYLSLEQLEQERLGSRPPLPLPPISRRKPDTLFIELDSNEAVLYDRVEPRLLGTNGLQLGLRDLAHHGWYWGPLTRVEAEEKLNGHNDGTFLVRDSSDERYFLSLSFRSQGKTLHTRIECCNGHFSFYSFPDSENEGYDSVAELIGRSMQFSSVGVFCFSRARAAGSPAVPVRLLKPLSRLTQIRSLQHYCRFVIRQSIRFDSIRQLPLPRHVHSFLEQSQY